MAENREVERIAKTLDKMVHKKSTDGALELLQELKNTTMSLETLQSTRVGMSVNAVRKLSSDEEVQTLAKVLIKSWKKLIDGTEKKTEEVKAEPLVRSSSTSKDAGQEKSSNSKPEEHDASLSARMTSFPPAPVTTDSVRNRCREMLVAALQTDGDYKSHAVDCGHLAAQIEDLTSLWRRAGDVPTPGKVYRHILGEIFQEFKSTDIKYKTRLRSRISNLKDQKNPELRRNVLSGNIGPERIASMTAEDMASAELKQIRDTLTKESIREHQLSRVGGTETDMFVCSKCKSKNCTYNQVQTRSADEPMTTFVVCNNCGNRWKFC